MNHHTTHRSIALGSFLVAEALLSFAPIMIWLAARAFRSLAHPVASTVAAFAAISVLARCIGIAQWLTVMQALAASHATADAAGQAQLEAVFRAINSDGGGIREIIGFSLMTTLALGTLCVAAWRFGSMPKWLTISGVLSAVLLAALLHPSLRMAFHVPIAILIAVFSRYSAIKPVTDDGI